jgi:hypothetical protein
MNTDKKNQHYVPKFYLRNFSFENNKKQIGVFNVLNDRFIQTAKLKTQGSKNFYYGADGEVEDDLANIEGELAATIREMIDQQSPPTKNSKGHYGLLTFVALMDLRNPARIDGMKAMLSEMRRRLLETDPNANVSKFVPDSSHKQLVELHLSHVTEMAITMLDLDYKLLVNKTSNPFITSDFPIVKYNQFLEQRKWPLSKVGFGLVGLQVFMPLSHELMLVLFDSAIYKVGDKKKSSHVITNGDEIDQLNILSFLNCIDTIFFDEKADERYIRKLWANSSKFAKANVVGSDMSFLMTGNDEHDKRMRDAGFKNLMRVKRTDSETNLSIEGVKIHSRGKQHQLDPVAVQVRPYVKRLQNSRSRI